MRIFHTLWFCVAIVSLTFAFGPPPAHAQAKPPGANPSAENQDLAERHFAEGKRLFKQQLYLAAIAAFKRSLKIIPHPTTIYNIAKSYEKLGVAGLCIQWFDKYLGRPGS